MITIYCYNKCSTCRNALKFLDNNKINYKLKDIIKERPDILEMKNIINRSGLDIKKFFNTSGNLYKELNLKEKLKDMDYEKMIFLLVSNGMLIKRPLVINNNSVLLGFKEEEWKNILK